MSKKVVFKTYHQDQLSLLPPSYDDLVPVNHPVRVVNTIIDHLDITALEESYKGGGTSSYHPRMLLKVIVYAYLRNLYSSRKIEQALSENIHFMWLSGQNAPDHNTINDFRGNRLKGHLKKIFNQVVLLLVGQGVVNLKDLYVDGTKIEANANRYTFVWGKSIKTNKAWVQKQLKELWSYVEKVYKDEQHIPNTPNFEAIDAEQVEATINKINDALQGKEVDKKIKQKLNYAKKNWPNNLKKYDRQEAILKNRNSYSKTDPDATFMRMKDDHMQNGQLRPGYNLQASTNNQYITNYTLGQTTADTTLLKDHMEGHIESYNETPESKTADAGYGSEENYSDLESKTIDAFVKYSYFHKEQKQSNKVPDPFHPDQLYHNKDTDTYYCPMGQAMTNIGSYKKQTKTGFEQTLTRYQAQNCNGCPLRGLCHKSKNNRIIERNYNLIRLKSKAKTKLISEQGIEKRKQRCWDVEAVFGNIKQNMNFKRFMLRGIDKANVEIGLIAMAHNLKKFSLAM
ncbi:MAG: IS1182 family transposase [Xanthomarina gelatinilytica]|uniref:IS1182 family transposase n=1 Tax=Xanthomarina gelatinilytica TaxID=1137281 RepID=UPI003A8A2B13